MRGTPRSQDLIIGGCPILFTQHGMCLFSRYALMGSSCTHLSTQTSLSALVSGRNRFYIKNYVCFGLSSIFEVPRLPSGAIWSGGSIGIPPVGGSRTGVTIMVYFFHGQCCVGLAVPNGLLSARNVISAEI